MKKFFLSLLVFVVFSLLSNAQENFAVIKDKDGYSNVREGNLNSKIVGKIEQYQPFFHEIYGFNRFEEYIKAEYTNMTFVLYYEFIKKDGYDFLQNDLEKVGEGYIHNSRIQKVEKLPSLKTKLLTNSILVLFNDSIVVTFDTGQFDKKQHTYTYGEHGENGKYSDVDLVDGKKAWGTFYNYPRNEIKSIKISYNNSTFELPKNSFEDIYEPNIENDFTKVHIGKDGELYITMHNSDGAATYDVIWVIVDKKVKYRLTLPSDY